MSLSQAFAALYTALETLATMDADLSQRLSVVYRRCVRTLDIDAIPSAALRGRARAVRDRLAAHDPEGAAGAAATRTACLSGLTSEEMEDIARQLVRLYFGLLMGDQSGANTRRYDVV
ncbi:hypothetical protein [uncultured Rhodospira sp.]|uniref:hypothetical protein n=1 Tax=uncultured Rhodospira sp. TaxID=1936189 RepID=UPI00262AC646|nr:hypothetical protein [uncultured Rhodospira sp.]